MDRLDNLVAVVTGGAGNGIGMGISLEMARLGAQVVILDSDGPAAERAAERLRSEGAQTALAITADVSSEPQVQAAFEAVAQELGRVDILVNSAGIGLTKPAHEVELHEFSRLLAVDFQGVWLCCKYAIPFMLRRKKGSIINIGSVHGTATIPNYSIYAGVKAGLAGFTRGLAVQYGGDGIRVNLVSPGLVESSQTRDLLEKMGIPPQQWMDEFIRRNQPLSIPIMPEDIGRAVAFLAGDDSRAITGIEIRVDAGAVAQLMSKE